MISLLSHELTSSEIMEIMYKNAWFKVRYDEKVYYNSIPAYCDQKLYIDSTIDVTDEEIEYFFKEQA